MFNSKVNLDDEGWMMCPHCDSNDGYMHHGALKNIDYNLDESVYFMSNIEDSSGSIPLIHKVSAKKNKIMIDVNVSLPYRGSSLAIPFWCEICGKNSYLYISQHKGNTHVGFIDTGHDLK